MKFLVDAQLPPALCRWITEKGFEAIHVAEIDMIDATDVKIADYAATADFIIISKDEDFLFLRLPNRFGLVWLRCGNTTNRALTIWLEARWENAITLLASGEPMIEIR